ncbi:CHAT domain-containing protein [Aeromicrobium sp.]|uniref:CHAT domain-containing protein n=1 Tax=Aeromicrobium sp. TaxID=1871063 RepID=UPI003D6C04E7
MPRVTLYRRRTTSARAVLSVACPGPLGHRNSVCYAPSLAVLLHTLGRPRKPDRPAAVFGDPRDNLLWAVEGARAVAGSLGVSVPATGAAVTREAVLAALRDAGTVRLAGHARASIDDEAVGLVRALLHGGARTLLTSQWRVRDDSARNLLTVFHRYDTTMPRADALRQAMRTAAGEHFYHWGGFVLVGDWR